MPQGPSGPAGEPLPLAARLQRVRQLAGQRRFGSGSTIVLLSAQVVHLLGLPHAAGCLAGSRQSQGHDPFAPLRRGNTAVASVNNEHEQLRQTEEFLKSGFITVDLFAAAPVEAAKGGLEMKRRASEAPAIASTFAVGEEAEQTGPVVLRDVGKIVAPLNAPGVQLQPDRQSVWMPWCAPARSATFFPAGTVDGYDVWLEFRARDARGRILAWSGRVEMRAGPRRKGSPLLSILPHRPT